MSYETNSPIVDRALAPVPLQTISSSRNHDALTALSQQARRDLQRLNYPAPNWVIAPHADNVLDVLIVGAGMCGQTAAFALQREGLRNIRIIDAAARGGEGPWATYARMLTLRSPKQLTGPDLGVPSLTFRAWYEAQHGSGDISNFDASVPGWAALHKIGRVDWRDYLLWVRDTADIPVENLTRLDSLTDEDSGAVARITGPHGSETVRARKVILALGRDGSGAPRWPSFPSLSMQDPLAKGRVFHTMDEMDFTAMQGKTIAVLGAGASAFDNAACALEAGATVQQFARRKLMPQINKSKAASFPGFLRGYSQLDDQRKWRFYTYIFDEQVPPPWETVRRCDAFSTFSLQLGCGWKDVQPMQDSVRVTLSDGSIKHFDAVIFGTGFDVDMLNRPELERYSAYIDTWAHHVSPQQAASSIEAARFPYLAPSFALQSVDGTHAEAMGRIHLFNWGATMTHAAVGSDIPGLGIGSTRLAHAISADLFVQDADLHWQHLQEFDESELLETRWHQAGEA
ncbi:NAD(P)-binding domain-containing protein [Comamonas avium]|uniref:NAD(P)/FAD-dependent oxidoreductase n=1 Tax=Comamonas avium TaxID=2762231 RepID=A0ABR8SBC4_9BURK|nr:NAD(P)/FAD-dependent oxidoreductase [Comamonas avium]MBD7960768.1 NAD(P)/FAD-dependent oxidoreductase [Comamonas avium]